MADPNGGREPSSALPHHSAMGSEAGGGAPGSAGSAEALAPSGAACASAAASVSICSGSLGASGSFFSACTAALLYIQRRLHAAARMRGSLEGARRAVKRFLYS